MKDIRISIRLTEEEHYLFKILAIKKKKNMQEYQKKAKMAKTVKQQKISKKFFHLFLMEKNPQ